MSDAPSAFENPTGHRILFQPDLLIRCHGDLSLPDKDLVRGTEPYLSQKLDTLISPHFITTTPGILECSGGLPGAPRLYWGLLEACWLFGFPEKASLTYLEEYTLHRGTHKTSFSYQSPNILFCMHLLWSIGNFLFRVVSPGLMNCYTRSISVHQE